jgi:hypothetical protein
MAMERDNTHVDRNPIMKVFKTPELCEQIMIDFDIHKLSRAKRVCRAFNLAINGSPILQRILFASPRSDTTATTLWVTLTTEPRESRQVLLIGPKTEDHPSTIVVKSAPTSVVAIHEKHPILSVQFWRRSKKFLARDIAGWANRARCDYFKGVGADVLDVVSKMSLSSALHGMYICQPPVKHMWCRMGNMWRRERTVEIRDDGGITFGHLHQALTEFGDGGVVDTDWYGYTKTSGIFDVRSNGVVPVSGIEQRDLESLGPCKVIWGPRWISDPRMDDDIVFDGHFGPDQVGSERYHCW